MAKPIADDYLQEIRLQRSVWLTKPSLRVVYRSWFERIVSELSELRPVVELGAGCGSFHEFYPDSLATDVVQGGPWIQQLVDARFLPWEDGSLGNIVMIDCLHHLPRPIRFLKSLERILKTDGRAVLFEPAATPFACRFWKRFHHEPLDLSYDFIEAERRFEKHQIEEPENPGFMYANMATAHRLFVTHWPEVRSYLPRLELQKIVWSDFLAYPLTGGFSYRSYAPTIGIRSLHKLESLLLGQTLARILGLRMLIVLSKRD